MADLNAKPKAPTKQRGSRALERAHNPVNDDSPLARYFFEIGDSRSLPQEEEARLSVRIREGDRKALDRMVRANLKFVVSVAKNYQHQGLPLGDLINEGNLGLIRAAKRFDETKNFKFISYAVWWIRQAILQALAEQSRIVALPLNRVGTIHKIGKAEQRLQQKLSRFPHPEEIAQELDIQESDVEETIRIGSGHISLDSPVDHDDDARLMDILCGDDQELPDQKIMESSLQNEVNKTLETLSDREQEILRLYFGIGEETSYTLEEIGQRFRLTRERARQIYPLVLMALGLLGFVWSGWWLWAVLIFLFGRTYAEPLDQITELDPRRKRLGVLTLIVFILVFTPVPLVLLP